MKSKLAPSVLALFCEDIRQEANGMRSVIGAYMDNVRAPGYPGVMAKLSVYVRANFPFDQIPKKLALRVETSWSKNTFALGEMDEKAIKEAAKNSKALKSDWLGVLITGVMSPFPVDKPGKVSAILNIDGKDVYAGFLNFLEVKKDKTSKGSKIIKKTKGAF